MMMKLMFHFITVSIIGILRQSLALDPSKFQVDLVFPQNNTIYKSFYPFPVVFAIHNFDKVWNYLPYVFWSLGAYEHGVEIMGSGAETRIGLDDFLPEDRIPSPPGSEVLAINSSYTIHTGRWQNWRLKYAVALARACNSTPYANSTGYATNGFFGVINFRIDNSTGIIPNITQTWNGTCAIPLGAVGIVGQTESPGCPVFANPRPEPDPCIYSLTENTENQVASQMMKISGCKSWPNISIQNSCVPRTPGLKSGATQLELAYYVVPIVISILEP
jgi:hypothetical protein